MIRAASIASLAMILATPVATAGSDDLWIHVRVKESKGDKPANVKVNVPVSLVTEILPAIDTDELKGGKIKIQLDSDGDSLSAKEMRDILRAVRNAKDGEYITVDDPEDHVRVAKSGGYLLIRAEESRDRASSVQVKVPLRAAEALLAGKGEELDLVAAIRALGERPEGELLVVDGDDDHVRIWIDGNASAN